MKYGGILFRAHITHFSEMDFGKEKKSVHILTQISPTHTA